MNRARATTFGIAVAMQVGGFVLVACGSRTGLLVPGDVGVVEPDGATVLPVGVDAASGEDVVDALPIIDTAVPDVVPPNLCADASNTLIYTVTQSNKLLRFDPQSRSFSTIGTLACPDPRSPFSMAVNHSGVGYVLYYDDTGNFGGPGSIYRVDLTNANCTPTTFVPGQHVGFDSFGMSFALATDKVTGLTSETLFIASDSPVGASGQLAAIDPKTFTLTVIGTFSPTIPAAELTGTSDGRLFAFYAPGFVPAQPNTGPTAIAQIDPTTAQAVAQDSLPTLSQGDAWAFGFWGGSFYTFTQTDPTGAATVTRYDPGTGALTPVATYPEPIVGAGVSTCAPAQ